MNSKPYPGTQAVLRAMSLLKMFTNTRPEWGVTDLAQAVKLNKTTTYRLLTALESEGFVTRSFETDAYRLGPELIALGGRAQRSNDLRALAHPELETLAQMTHETATLEVMRDGDVLILDEVLSHHLIGATPSVGTRWPAHATSTGKALLAWLSPAERSAVLPRRLATPTTRTLADRESLSAELNHIREQGYAVANGELEDSYVAVGAPVFNHAGQAIAALSVGGPSTRLTTGLLTSLARLVVQAAGRVSQQLGFQASDS